MIMKRVLSLLAVLVLSLSLLSGCGGKKSEFGEFTWPSTPVAAQLPIPESHVGQVQLEKEDYLSVYVGETSMDGYNAYVEQCKAKGFTVDYSSAETYYTADNDAGYHLYISYDDRNEMMDIMVSKGGSDDSNSASGSEETAAPDDESGDTTADASDDGEDGLDDEDSGTGAVGDASYDLPGGKYVVGEDLSPGKYNLIYKTKLGKDDYWSNDYLYIIESGSEGSQETMGGTKYDDRLGSVSFEDAKEGKDFFLNLKDGDTIEVESENGNWLYGCDSSSSVLEETTHTGSKLPEGKYTIGDDLDAGKYRLEYTTKESKSSYWSNDYFYITRSGSKGTQETMGGTKYDERFGSVKYKYAKDGAYFYVNLKDGDKIVVESSHGSWTY